MRIALIGGGTIARLVLDHIRRGELGRFEVVGLLGRAEAAQRASARTGALFFVPSGGIGGLDALKTACIAGVDEASIQVAKPPVAWKGIPYVERKGVRLE